MELVVRDARLPIQVLTDPPAIDVIRHLDDGDIRSAVSFAQMRESVAAELIERKNTIQDDYSRWLNDAFLGLVEGSKPSSPRKG